MTYREDFTLPPEMLARIASQGFDVLPDPIRMVVNAATQMEREQYLKAAPYQHTPERQGHANGHDFEGKARKHHEIYFSDPRRSAPEKMKTIIRQPVKK